MLDIGFVITSDIVYRKICLTFGAAINLARKFFSKMMSPWWVIRESEVAAM
jgi:hypothetical protein